MHISQRHLQVAFGVLWLLDGILQLQPYMFIKGSDGFLGPLSQNTTGAPNPLTDFLHIVISLMVAHQIAFTVGIAVVQIGIGVGLFWPRTLRFVLVVSGVWAIGVWIVGEGVGQLIFPQASMLSGAPGAAIVYAVLSVVLWPRSGSCWTASTRNYLVRWWQSGAGARMIWAVLWCGTAMLELESANWAPDAISAQLHAAASGQPGWLARIYHDLSKITAGVGTEIAFGFLVVEFLVGWGILRPLTRNFSLKVGIVVSVVLWVTGQGLGGLFTGTSSDPNLGPGVVLFAPALWAWPVKPVDANVDDSGLKIGDSEGYKIESLHKSGC